MENSRILAKALTAFVGCVVAASITSSVLAKNRIDAQPTERYFAIARVAAMPSSVMPASLVSETAVLPLPPQLTVAEQQLTPAIATFGAVINMSGERTSGTAALQAARSSFD